LLALLLKHAYIDFLKKFHLAKGFRSQLSAAERSNASFSIRFNVCSVKHINALCSVVTQHLGDNFVSV